MKASRVSGFFSMEDLCLCCLANRLNALSSFATMSTCSSMFYWEPIDCLCELNLPLLRFSRTACSLSSCSTCSYRIWASSCFLIISFLSLSRVFAYSISCWVFMSDAYSSFSLSFCSRKMTFPRWRGLWTNWLYNAPSRLSMNHSDILRSSTASVVSNALAKNDWYQYRVIFKSINGEIDYRD